MERREFLKRAGLIAGAVTVGGGTLPPRARGSPRDRSFDSILNHSAEGLEDRHRRRRDDGEPVLRPLPRAGWPTTRSTSRRAGAATARTSTSAANNQLTLPRPARASAIPTAHLVSSIEEPVPFRGCDHPIPGHGWNTGRAQRDRGFIGHDTGNDQFALGYYEAEDLALYRELAHALHHLRPLALVAARGHVPEPPVPALRDVRRAQGGPDPARGRASTRSRRSGTGSTTEQVPARYYYTDLPVLTLWGPRLYDQISPDRRLLHRRGRPGRCRTS